MTAKGRPGATAEWWDDGYLTVADGTKLHYLDVGEGPPVVLLHGARGSAVGNWFRTGVGPALVPTNRVIAIDMRGHGLSDRSERRGHDLYADDVLEVMDQLGVERAHIGGYSMGGAITLRILASEPERFITAFFAGAGIPDPAWTGPLPPDKEGPDPDAEAAAAALEARRAAKGEEIGNNFGPGWGGGPGGPGRGGPHGPGGPGAHGPGPGGPWPMGPQPTRDGWGGPGGRGLWDLSSGIDLSRVRFPVMAVNGEYDRPLARTHRMWRELHDFTNVVLEGKGHLSAVMPGFVPRKLVDAIVRFVTGNNGLA